MEEIEMSHCSCGAIGEEGHTFQCILEQKARRQASLKDQRDVVVINAEYEMTTGDKIVV